MYCPGQTSRLLIACGAAFVIGMSQADRASACPCIVDFWTGPASCTPDGQVGFADLTYIQDCVMFQADTWCGQPLSVCDVNCDGDVNDCDVAAVMRGFLGYTEPCVDLVCGACCYNDGTCRYKPQDSCEQDTGTTYIGDEVSCTPDPCPGFCGDGVCDGPVENPCNCPPDCGDWVPAEEPGATCDDGIDNDCDGAIDCQDELDCLSDPACGPYCPNTICEEPDEDSCNCPEDCGDPPATEDPGTTCDDGIDNDCDGWTDCDDEPDCLTDPACGPYCPNTVCESPDEDSCICPEDCGEPPATETPGATCDDGLDNDCDGWTDCDDEPDCLTDPACGPYCPNTVCEEPDEDYCSCPEDCEVPPESQDCNGNGLPDDCDIADGTSQDCNVNGIPDECEWTVLAQSTFEADEEDDGWHEYQPDEVEISWVASGGNPGGYLRTRDPSMYSGARIAAPPEFLGDWSAIDGVAYFQFDARFIMDPGNYPLSGTFPYILLIGSGGVASYHFDVLWSTDWQTFSAPVNEALWVVSEGTWADLLANVEVVLLGAEATLGRDENGFDNIFLLVSDCNDNGVLDECDIESGTSEDCNTNGVPDECDITGGMRQDCNENSVPDECDVAEGTSPDCNENGIPDECEVPWTLAVSTFDEGIEGWEEYPPEDINIHWEPTGGNPDGFLWTQDASTRSAMILAPLEYTGDWSALDGVGIIRYDTMFIDDPDGHPLVGHPHVTLIGPGGTASCSSDLVQPTNWQTFTFPLNGALWNVTEGTWAGLLADVTHLILHADHTTGRDIHGFDNVFVGVPGEGQDCNENRIPDECDIGDGTSQDCNANGVPDECDIADGTSDDANENGVPDECDIGACCDDSSRLCADGVADDDCPGRWMGGAVCSTAPFDPPCGLTPRIALVPVAPPPETGITYLPGTVISGNEITIPVGQKVWLDVTLSRWDWDLDGDPQLYAWEAHIDSSGYASGLQGRLTPAYVPCVGNADCEAALGHGAVCDRCMFDACDPGFIDTARADWSMASCPQPFLGGVDCSTLNYRFGALCCNGDQACSTVYDPGVPQYGATIVLEIPENAQGTFSIGFFDLSYMLSPESEFIVPLKLEPAQITTRLASCCLPEGDCIDMIPSDCADGGGTVVEMCLGDGDGNGQDDACQCPRSSQPEPERLDLFGSPISRKVRYLSFSAGDAGQTQAIRVMCVDLPAPYDTWNGTVMWVQEPEVYCENAGVSQQTPCPSSAGGLPQNWFWGAELGCDPHWTDWTQYDVVHVWHEGIIPDGTYDLQAIDSTCSTDDESAYSPPLTLTQSVWADVVQDCTTVPCGPPDGSTGIADVTAILDKWKNLTGNVSKVRADLEGSPAGDHRVPDQAINITDVTYCLGAFLGQTYPGPGFPPPSDPPVCP